MRNGKLEGRGDDQLEIAGKRNESWPDTGSQSCNGVFGRHTNECNFAFADELLRGISAFPT